MRRPCLFCTSERLYLSTVCALHVDDVRAHRRLVIAQLREGRGRGVNLSGLYFVGLELPGAFLEHADFTEADLRGADLSGADLERANFQRADLRGANLAGARLQVANFHDANLVRTKLSGCHLEGAHFSHARLQDADLSSTKLNGTQFRGSDLSRASFAHCDARRTSFSAADLSGCDFRGATLRDVSVLDTRGLDSLRTDATTKNVQELLPRARKPSPPPGSTPRPSEFQW